MGSFRTRQDPSLIYHPNPGDYEKKPRIMPFPAARFRGSKSPARTG